MGLTDLIDAAWSRLVVAARRTTPILMPQERVVAWADCAGSVRELFAIHVGEKAVNERLNIPADYAAFMERVGGGWEWLQGLDQSLFTAASVARESADDYRLWVTERDEDDGPQDDGFWLRIGRYSDNTIPCCAATRHTGYTAGCWTPMTIIRG